MPFNADLDSTPIDVVASHYGARPNAAWNSVISTQLTVLSASAKSLSELLAAKETGVVDEVAAAADGVTLSFSGTLDPHSSTPRTVEVKVSTITFTATVGASGVDITDDGNGALSGANCTGTIDYVTGAWTLVFTGTAPDNSTNIVVDYTWFFTLPIKAQGLWLSPGGDIRVTFSPNGAPTGTSGILIYEAIMLAGQRNLILQASFIAAADTALDVEIMV